MPLFYNTTEPTSNNKNSITKTALDYGLRDFLLNRNIQNPIRYPQLSTSINGSPRGGEPVLDTMVNGGVVYQQNPLEVDGVFRYGNAIIMNQYKNNDALAPVFENIDDIPRVPIYPTSPSGTGTYQDENIDVYGLLSKSNFSEFRKVSTLKNKYVDTTKQRDIGDDISNQTTPFTEQLGSYIDEYGNLTIERGNSNGIDIIGSILNNQGVGFDSDGLVTNFDIKASIIGRVLGGTGIINDTRLGIIGAKQLAFSLGNNAAFNIQQELFGTLNIGENILNLIKDGSTPMFRPNYRITVPDSGVIDAGNRILGFTIPRSYLNMSIFQSENGNVENISRANKMLENTGKGQVTALIANMRYNISGTTGYDIPDKLVFRSGYAPGYKDKTNNLLLSPNIYAYSTPEGNIDIQLIRTINTDISQKKSDEFQFDTRGMSWVGTNDSVNKPTEETVDNDGYRDFITTMMDKKTLLNKTQTLFNNVGMKTMTSARGSSGNEKSQIQTSTYLGFISKGSGVLSEKAINSDSIGEFSVDDVFCRTWSKFRQYENVDNLIRHSGLTNSRLKNSSLGSVLGDGGFVKIAPSRESIKNTNSPKKYMFSIENLAWYNGAHINLPEVEKGSGDLLSGVFGRIMWFPPYDISFNENNSVSLETNIFIGRGEPIYTYNNTERSGTLSFKIIVDHPSAINDFAGKNGPEDDFIRSWFAGCITDNKYAKTLTQTEKNEIETKVIPVVSTTVVENIVLPSPLEVYFPNDITDINYVISKGYEDGINDGIGDYEGEKQFPKNGAGVRSPRKPGRFWPDKTNFSLNKSGTAKFSKYRKKLKVKPNGTEFDSWNDSNYISELKKYMQNECISCTAKITGQASSQGSPFLNTKLAKARAEALTKWLVSNEILPESRISSSYTININGTSSYTNLAGTDSLQVKVDRRATIEFISNVQDKPNNTTPEPVAVPDATQNNVRLNDEISNRFYTEQEFFEDLTSKDKFIFDDIRTKIKYFHPAFHSTTPEGLNSRLTFLLQCTRQGATNGDVGPKNLAFGPQPVCILRIGDFYNTKIMIDNVSFDFDPLVWDLNPEGIGVQPMIANVNMTFKYIGGSTLYGPISRLQNALSFNYFANSEVYDARADYISGESDYKLNLGESVINGNSVRSNKNNVNNDTKTTNGATQKDISEKNNTGITPSSTTPQNNDKITYSLKYEDMGVENGFYKYFDGFISEYVRIINSSRPASSTLEINSLQTAKVNASTFETRIIGTIKNSTNTGDIKYKISQYNKDTNNNRLKFISDIESDKNNDVLYKYISREDLTMVIYQTKS